MRQVGSRGAIYPPAGSSGAQADDFTPGQVAPWPAELRSLVCMAAGCGHKKPSEEREDQLDRDTFI